MQALIVCLREQELVAFETLIQEAQRWHQFKILDTYLDELGRNPSTTPAFGQWLAWAKSRRQIFDPINKRKDIR